MEYITLILFCAMLLTCIALNQSILYALSAGLLLFLIYGRHKGFSWKELLKMCLRGVGTVKNILITFLLIGLLTALWRAAGTIPVVVGYASLLVRPSIFLLMTFLLNCGVSMLTGTAFGTAATMGVICATMGASLNVDVRLVGGAVLSGVFFGDRCSPVSTSALLVAELTQTGIYDNIRRMLRSALVPFILSVLIYAGIGYFTPHTESLPDLRAIFGREFEMHWLAALPAVVILLLSLLRVNVKLAMLASILTALPICLFLQRTEPSSLLRLALLGYTAEDAEVGAMLNGGGIASMVRVACIVSLSSSYSGIFRKVGLLNGVGRLLERLAQRSNAFVSTFLTAVISGMLACNQTLSIMLTHQLCGKLESDKHEFANSLEDTAVVISPLIPWSIAGAVPLASVGAPMSAIALAVYLYLLPLWHLVRSFASKKAK